MEIGTGTAMTAEKHFSHDFRMPFTSGQIFGVVPIDYSKLSAWELDTCLVHSRSADGDSFPSASVRKGLAHLLDGVHVKDSVAISSRNGGLCSGLFVCTKVIKKGDVVGIYAGTATRSEGNDSLYLFQLEHKLRDDSGKLVEVGRVIDGSPSSRDPWTVFGRINEWIWKSGEAKGRNNCEVMPGGTIIA